MRIALENGKYKRHIKTIWMLFVLAVFGSVLFIWAVGVNFLGLFGELPSLQALENPRSELASEIYSADGKLMGKLYLVNRIPVEYEEISPYVINALIATEDVRFEKHAGVDLKGLARVFFKTILLRKRESGGGSTLTQQLAKNLFETRAKESLGPLARVPGLRMLIIKAKEWITAVRLERNYTKREIITMYLNEVAFGHNAFGIEAAAHTFFNKSASELNAIEAATLVGLLQAPSRYSPVSHPEACRERRNVVLGQMYKYGFLDKDTYSQAIATPVKIDYHPEDPNEGIAPYFRAEVREFMKKWEKERGLPENNFYTAGYKIYTTIDSRVQAYAEQAMVAHMKERQKRFNQVWSKLDPWYEVPGYLEAAARQSERYRTLKQQYGDDEKAIFAEMRKPIPMTVFSWEGEKDTIMSPMDSIRYYKRFLHAGLVCIEAQTGKIRAWVGGINFKHFRYDHVKQGRRQPGSTFKPVVYATAIDMGYTPCYEMVDKAVTFGDWSPQNSYGGFTGRSYTLRQALGRSINTIAAQLIMEIGVQNVVKFARQLGITSPLDPVGSLALGSSAVTLYELCQAYSVFLNQGKRIDNIYISRITDRNGKVIEEFVPDAREVMSEEKAYMMLHMLKASLEPGGTSVGLHRYGITQNNEIAAKTGTTQNHADGWFIGVTKDYVAGVWVGGDDMYIRFPSILDGQGAVLALPIWGNFTKAIYEDKSIPYKPGYFPRPAQISVELDCNKLQEGVSDKIKIEIIDDEAL